MLVRKSGRENKEVEGKEREERWKNTGKVEEKGGGTPSQHQLMRKSGRENREMKGKGRRDGKIQERQRRREEERHKSAPTGEKEWKREQGDGRKRKGGEMGKNTGKIEEKGGGTPNQKERWKQGRGERWRKGESEKKEEKKRE
jgi:hypothetical protein